MLKIRAATISDSVILAELIDAFTVGHPSEAHPRSLDRMQEAYFGSQPLSKFVLAHDGREVVGFAGWSRVYDMFWSIFGGVSVGLFVRPEYRGRGVAACLVASVCQGIRTEGGGFLRATYDDNLSRFYERVAVGRPIRECHLSAQAFSAVADLADRSPREIVRSLPSRELNYVE